MKIRRATPGDSRTIFQWANDPESRAASVIGGAIEWETHEGWFAQRLSDLRCDVFLVIDDDEEPVGFVRFEGVREEESEISVNLAPDRRGGGTGTKVIRMGCDAFFEVRPNAQLVVASIKHENIVSQRAFAKAGFVPAGEHTVRGSTVLRFERKRD
ncbi:MAG: hypothetical protein NVSMB57_08660 [Actinomycetota bacterium]